MQSEKTTEGWLKGLSPKKRDSASTLINTIVRDVQRCKHDIFVCESAIGYVRNAARGDFSWSTTQTVHGELLSRLNATAITVDQARGYGFPVRKVAKGKHRGGLYAFAAPAYERVVRIAGAYSRDIIARTLAADFVSLRVKHAGEKKMYAHCPFHEDRKPSTSFAFVDDGSTAKGSCFRCVGEDGKPLRLFAVRYQGAWYVRKARGNSGVNNRDLSTRTKSGTITREQPAQPDRTPRRHYTADTRIERHHLHRASRVCTKMRGVNRYEHDYGMEQSRTDQTRLLDILRFHDRLADSKTDAAWCNHAEWQITGGDPKQAVPDRFVAMELMTASEWIERTVGDRNIKVPKRFRPYAVTHVLIDLDGFTAAPKGNDAIVKLESDFVTLGKSHGFSGEVTMVRTSESGLHVAFGLEAAQSTAWFADVDVQRKLRLLGAECLRLVWSVGFEGGHHDTATLRPGAHIRRPGPRIAKDGQLYVVRLVFAAKADVAIEPRQKKRIRRPATVTVGG